MEKPNTSETLYCFSPPVMITTFLIEILLAGYVLWRYKFSSLLRLVIVTLILLATFQLAEFNICGGSIMALDWSRLGFVAISVLPPLGIHMVTAITGRKRTNIMVTTYALGSIFAIYFGFFPHAVFHELCGGNYIIFHLDRSVGWLYGIYYYGALIAIILLSMYEFRRPKTSAKTKQTLRWYILGMLVFMVPTTVANTLDPSTLAEIPSILCGFAVLYALLLAFVIVPAQSRLRRA